MTLYSIDPSNGKQYARHTRMHTEEINHVLEASHQAYLSWKKTEISSRAEYMRRAAIELRKQKNDLSVLMAHEMGKPIGQGVAEVEKCAWVCEYYAEKTSSYLERDIIQLEDQTGFVCYRPLGVILAIMPWNFPFWQVFRFAAPGLMAGNAAVLKHASNVQGSAKAIENIFRKAGFPDEIFVNLTIHNKQVAQVISHHRIAAVTFTGSAPAGRMVAAQAGKYLKKTVLELGGSDAYIILEDADLEHAAKICAAARLINSGQSCIAAKRFVVVRSVEDRFVELLVDKMRSVQVGDPLNKATEVGPLARLDLRTELHRQVTQSVNLGARIVLGGEIPTGPGAFYPPSVLTDVGWGMPAYEEELFGPVAAVVSVDNRDEAVRVANDTEFGLGACVFSEDVDRATRIAQDDLEAGICFVNTPVRSDPRLPFGGIKQSGYGRELSRFGLLEFVNIKSMVVG